MASTSLIDGEESSEGAWKHDDRKMNAMVRVASIVLGVLVIVLSICLGLQLASGGDKTTEGPMGNVPITGVNFGGWLVLEDWFFSGGGGVDVSSSVPGQGACLPPLLLGVKEPWPSEGILTHRLNATVGAAETARIFTAHRVGFIGEEDLRQVAQLGMKVVRVPIPWQVFPDALAAIDESVYGSFNPRTDSVVVPDPFYTENVSYVTVPREWLEGMIKNAAGHGIKFILDIHAYPSGAAEGTYNGVWPLKAAFWRHNAQFGNGSVPLSDIGLLIAEACIRWVETMDSSVRDGVAGITLMNEPGHMANWQDFADEAQIFSWLARSSDIFRKSTLPGLGIKLYVNIINTAVKDFWGTVPKWWETTFTLPERQAWAVIDTHWYSSWLFGICDGRTVEGGSFLCDASSEQMEAIWNKDSCIRGHAQRLQEHFGDVLKSCSEFSAGTYANAQLACNDLDVTRHFVKTQVKAFQEFNVETFFWTWRMPQGQTFQSGWSYKYIAGLESPSSAHPCDPRFANGPHSWFDQV